MSIDDSGDCLNVMKATSNAITEQMIEWQTREIIVNTFLILLILVLAPHHDRNTSVITTVVGHLELAWTSQIHRHNSIDYSQEHGNVKIHNS